MFATGARKAISVESLPDIWLSQLYKGGGYEIKKGSSRIVLLLAVSRDKKSPNRAVLLFSE